MATKPEAWQEQSPVNSLNNETWTQDEVVAAASHNNPLQDKVAPRAEPEEDIDVMEPGAEEATQQEKETFTPDEMDGNLLENQETTNEVVTEIGRSETLDSQEEESCIQSEAVLPPPPPLSDLSLEEFSSLEREEAEWIGDAEIVSEPIDLSPNSESQEWPQSADRMVSSSTENVTQDVLNISADGFGNSQPENDALGTVHLPFDSNLSDDERAVCSPRFVDESDGDEGINTDVTSCPQQQASLEVLQPGVSVSTDAPPSPADTSGEQQGELLTQSQHGHAPMGGNQEAAQQVHDQSSPPLSPVSIEVSNQGVAASVVAARERHHGVGERTEGERTEGESERSGGEEGQKEGVLEAEQQRRRGLSETGKSTCAVCFSHSRQSRMESDSCDDSQSDSGVSADFSPCSTLESNAAISTGTPPSGAKETPIEREIRRAIEREHSLRRSRGLPSPPNAPEYVDIPLRKAVLTQSLAANSERHQGKDRQFAGKKMQHDIHRETQREQDLVKLGKVPGVYDKGTVRQLKDRKLIFEVFQKPSDSSFTVPARSKVTSCSLASDIFQENQEEEVSSQVSTVRASNGERRQSSDLSAPAQGKPVAKQGDSTNLTARGPGYSEATGCHVIILENHMSVPALKLYHAEHSGSPSAWPGRKQDTREEEVEAKENPFFKLRPSANVGKVEQEICEAKEREKELRQQRTSVYRGAGVAMVRGPTSVKGQTAIMSPSPPNGPTAPNSSRGGTGSTAGERRSVFTWAIVKQRCLCVWTLVRGGMCVTADENPLKQPSKHNSVFDFFKPSCYKL